MRLSEIRVQNFRNLRDVTLALNGGFNVIVGRNNIGKTNLLHAVRHALGPQDSQGDPLWLRHEDLHCTPNCAPTESTIRIDLTYSHLSHDHIANFFELLVLDLDEPTRTTAQLHFEATWNAGRERFSVVRWGGTEDGERILVPTEVLAGLQATFLTALRDAEASLVPGRNSRIAHLFNAHAKHDTSGDKEAMVGIFRDANTNIEALALVKTIERSLQKNAQAVAGSDYVLPTVKATEPGFDRIIRSLRLVFEKSPIPDIGANGLGYNNLLFIATILAHLENAPDDESPLLLVEEPEAHLHPQLTAYLGDYLAERCDVGTGGALRPQAIVTSHSPVLASNVKPSQVSILFESVTGDIRACNVSDAGLSDSEERQLQRMLDATKASLYFARGLILVEGISEALLIPQLARRIGIDLRREQISVLPVYGIAFGTFKKLLSVDALAIPCAIVTDGDPPTIRVGDWGSDVPEAESDSYATCDRLKLLKQDFPDSSCARVFHSDVTLEFDLAMGGQNNPDVMTHVWETLFARQPRTLNRSLLANARSNPLERALVVWRGICRADPSCGKAEFAHRLSDYLAVNDDVNFEVPPYLRRAIEYVHSSLGPTNVPTNVSEANEEV